MRGRLSRHSPLFAALVAALALAVLASLSVGALSIPFPAVLGWLGLPTGTTPAPHEAAALLQLRLPRIVLALAIGAALAMSGTAMQGLIRNPLADPGLIGISSGAALSACAVMVLGVSLGLTPLITERWLLPIGAFAGAAIAATLALRLARADGYTRMTTLLLAGLAINAVAGAGIGFLAQIADEQALRSITFWMFGSLGRGGWPEVATATALLLIPLLILPRVARPLNALLLGEAEAGHLGVDTERLKRLVMLLIVLAVGTAVAVAGIIGFVGLIVPHILRLICGPDHRPLLPASALGGALLLLGADTAARTWFAPSELPIGILTALLGGPFFLALLLRYRDRPELG
jgi:iron complex transport system permease protein